MKKEIERIKRIQQRLITYRKPKVFGIGANKTGTTSLKAAMKDLGFLVGSEYKAKGFIDDWAKREFHKIIKFCYSARFFQDQPFSLPYTYIALDQAFPKCKFILTVRDDPEQWYNSVINHMSVRCGKNGRLPTKEDLQNAEGLSKGWEWKATNLKREINENDIYNKAEMIENHNRYNANVKEYFRHRPNDLLILNVSEKNAHKKLCDFLGITSTITDFPWKNKGTELKNK